jgi:release factor glutamine methyltransferase
MPQQAKHAGSLSLRESLRDAIARLERERVPSAALAAELLLMHVLGQDRAWIYAHPEHELDAIAHEKYFSLVASRANGVPTQHLTGHQEFWGMDFEVTPDVLIPRPETEHVIEVVLDRFVAHAFYAELPGRAARGVLSEQDRARLDENPQATLCDLRVKSLRAFRIADVGTGSGCIAVALARELPEAHILATDISPLALEVALRNARRHEVASRIDFVECNLLDAFLRGPRIHPEQVHRERATDHGFTLSRFTVNEPRSFDLIASNPPYIGRSEAATLPREVREHEPEIALFAGETGTELYAPLIAQAAELLKLGGFLVLELGHDSAEYVTRVLSPPQWTNLSITNDLAGIPRVVSAERRA